jgi:hypothetical protein
VFSDGSVLDSIENIALLNADNVMTGTNTLTGGDEDYYHVVESLTEGTGGLGRRWYSRIYGLMDGRYLTIYWRCIKTSLSNHN